jgi:hypothetical protein
LHFLPHLRLFDHRSVFIPEISESQYRIVHNEVPLIFSVKIAQLPVAAEIKRDNDPRSALSAMEFRINEKALFRRSPGGLLIEQRNGINLPPLERISATGRTARHPCGRNPVLPGLNLYF